MGPSSSVLRTTLATIVDTAKGCAERCKGCGAYEGRDDPSEWKVEDLTRHQIRLNMKRALDAGFQFSELVYTYPNTEPLGGPHGTFRHMAEGIYEFTGGKSRAVLVTHGQRVGTNGEPVKRMDERMDEYVDLMRRGVVPVSILSVDNARQDGEIEPEVNINSYVATLKKFRPLLEFPEHNTTDVRITVSVQGTPGEGPLSMGESELMYQEVLRRLGWPPALLGRLHDGGERDYAFVGRAAKYLPGLSEDGHCDVLPDKELSVFLNLNNSTYLNSGRILMNGAVVNQRFRPGHTYNTTIKGPWKRVWTPEGVVEEVRTNVESGLVQIEDPSATLDTPRFYKRRALGPVLHWKEDPLTLTGTGLNRDVAANKAVIEPVKPKASVG